MKIFLADLTYTQATLASDVVPAAIGGLAELLERECAVEVEIFKLPEILLSRLEQEQPNVLGLSNYIWNSTLSSKVAKIVKKYFPKIITVTGGPNIPSERDELHSFLINNLQFDFAVLKEGEIGIKNLINFLKDMNKNSNLNQITELESQGFAFLDYDNKLVMGKLARYLNLEDLPSPYLSGRLDPFLDGKFLPVLQTNRGCPFTCTFCTEGQHYWSKVQRKPLDLIRKEVSYIAKKLTQTSNPRRDLLIADSNFGMYEPDLEVAREIAKVQHELNYPTYINVATGKNKKERVLETAKIVNGAMKLAGSVQSLDEQVLLNIKRDNISPDGLLQMALEASSIGTNTYSEVILGLPGDSKEAHFDTLKKLIDAGFTTLAMYQMMLLPATEMNKIESREKYEFKSKFRLLPRCFGYFEFLGEKFYSAEIEEIVIAHKSLSEADYLSCRVLNLLVTLFYNDGVFLEFHRLIKQLNGSSFDWIYSIYQSIPDSNVQELVNSFKKDTLGELWLTYDELELATTETNLVQKAIDGLVGHNILFFYKSKSLAQWIRPLIELAATSYKNYLKNLSVTNQYLFDLIDDMFRYREAQISEILNGVNEVNFNINNLHLTQKILNELEQGKIIDLELLIRSQSSYTPESVSFELEPIKFNELNAFIQLFGDTDIGQSRILSRIFLRNFFRQPVGYKSTSKAHQSAVPSSQFGFRET